MKEIILKIEDEIFTDLEQSIIVKGMVGGLFGTMDEFITLLVKAIRDGKETVTIIKKKKRKKKKKKK